MIKTTLPLTVLLVDDEVAFLAATSKILTRRGMTVLTETNGKDALLRLAETPVDVVVLDVKMPGMDGDEVFRRIVINHPGLPVIMLTGHGSISHAFDMSKDGVFDYIAKPCDADALAVMIRQAAGGRPERPADETNIDLEPDEPVSVLLVDDDEEFLESFSQVLERRKMTISTAVTGELALNLLRRAKIDVVVLDVRMPGIGGLETLQHIKLEFPDIEVILLTGNPDISSAVSAMRIGAIEYLPKPPDTEALTVLIRNAAREVRKRREKHRRKLVQDVLTKQPD